MTAKDLLQQKIIDRIVPEPVGGAHKNPKEAAEILKKILLEELGALAKIKPEKLVENRIAKFDAMGSFSEK